MEESNAQNAASVLSRTTNIPEGCHLEAPSTSNVYPVSSETVEMSDLSSSGNLPAQSQPPPVSHESSTAQGLSERERPHTDTALDSTHPDPQTQFSTSQDILHVSSPPTLTREQTAPAIGPATDMPSPVPRMADLSGPQLMITLLLTTGARHPYKIDEKYLKKRNVSVTDNNPVNMSVYTLKELIWRDWREDWEPRPSSPSSIRLIHYGKMLDDKAHLKDGRFLIGDTPHVVHMTIKPQEVVDDEDARIAKGGGRDRDGSERSPGCRCVIM
ncbi:hypothetical protein MMC13_006388 [Lambiella insularis]|nr:hypothetical protein [Lambiella insularis]